MTASAFRNRAAIVGVGYTPITTNSGRTTLSLALDAITAALDDCGLTRDQLDGFATFSSQNDSATPFEVAQALGIKDVRYYLNQGGGGSTSHTIIGEAAMACILGVADYVVCWRSLNGRSGFRLGATGRPPAASGGDQYLVPHGYSSPGQRYAMAMRVHMNRYGTTPEQLGMVSVTQRQHATLNPRALKRDPITLDDYLHSRWIADPLRLFDFCLETDAACAVIVTTAERARDLQKHPVLISGAVWGPGHSVSSDEWSELTEIGAKYTAPRLFEQADLCVEDVDVAQLYDCFSPTVLFQLEGYGFCGPGEAGPFIASGATSLGGSLPLNTHGGFLSEGYIHGMNTLCEAVLQLRGEAGGRQVRDAEVALSTGGDGMLYAHTSAVLVQRA